MKKNWKIYFLNRLSKKVNNGSLEDGDGPPPMVPPRRKHSGKMLKQQAELSASLLSNSSSYQGFSGLPPIPKVKVRLTR